MAFETEEEKAMSTQEKIDAVNKAVKQLKETKLVLQNAFGVEPDISDLSEDIAQMANDLFGSDIFNRAND